GASARRKGEERCGRYSNLTPDHAMAGPFSRTPPTSMDQIIVWIVGLGAFAVAAVVSAIKFIRHRYGLQSKITWIYQPYVLVIFFIRYEIGRGASLVGIGVWAGFVLLLSEAIQRVLGRLVVNPIGALTTKMHAAVASEQFEAIALPNS